MESNPQLDLARRFIETTGTHLFLTGRAGTGKTTFLQKLKADSPKRMVVLAPTGIAALQAGGVTIHSFFQLPLSPYIPGTSFAQSKSRDSYRYNFRREKINILRSIDLLVIDEISMVRADLLDAVDDVLRRYRRRSKPFGGVQLLMIGDLQQLAPVVKDEEWNLLRPYYDTPYFFSSQALRQTRYCTIELTHVYRQTDTRFLDLLNSVRDERPNPDVIRALNNRYIPHFNPDDSEGYVRLVTHVHQAQLINNDRLEALPGHQETYPADVEGQFPEYAYPTDRQLVLKVGARVMFVKNDPTGNGLYYNGMLGQVTELDDERVCVRRQGTDEDIEVDRVEWTNSRYTLNEETKEIEETVEGMFRQYPLKTAWAITIHKSQGLTFDRVIIDAARSFAHGQTYVALSRCRTLEGVVLSSRIDEHAFINDNAVSSFSAAARATEPNTEQLMRLQQAYFTEQLSDLFDFAPLEQALKQYVRLAEEFLYKIYPKHTEESSQTLKQFQSEVSEVARRFSLQYNRLIAGSADGYATDPALQDRIRRGAEYFASKMALVNRLAGRAVTDVDNKETRKKLQQAVDDMRQLLRRKANLLNHVAEQGFELCDYLRRKAIADIEEEPAKKEAKLRPKKAGGRKPKDKDEMPSVSPDDIPHRALYDDLRAWRSGKARETGVAPYMVLQQKALIGICTLLPTDKAALLRVPYVGSRTVERFGDDIMERVIRYRQKQGMD